MAKRIPDDVREVLERRLTWDDSSTLEIGSLDRKLYVDTAKVLKALGGKWNRSRQRTLFDGDGESLIADAAATGLYLDPKQELQFFETPPEMAAELAARAVRFNAMLGIGAPLLGTVLEPSAGKGALARAARDFGREVHCCEQHPPFCEELREQGFDVTDGDFLGVPLGPLFDAVLMNPPFSKGQDIAHIRHAYDFLREDGRLVAVASAGVEFRQTRKFTEFREWLGEVGGEMEPNPEHAFRSSGTDVRTVTITIDR